MRSVIFFSFFLWVCLETIPDKEENIREKQNSVQGLQQTVKRKKAFSEREILALQTLNPNKACGPDHIITEFLKVSAGK